MVEKLENENHFSECQKAVVGLAESNDEDSDEGDFEARLANEVEDVVKSGLFVVDFDVFFIFARNKAPFGAVGVEGFDEFDVANNFLDSAAGYVFDLIFFDLALTPFFGGVAANGDVNGKDGKGE